MAAELSRWIERQAATRGDGAAIVFAGETLTYAELWRRVLGAAKAMAGPLGIRPGDRVAYLGLNAPAVLELLFAASRIGAVFVPLNHRLTPAEHAYMIERTEPKVLVAAAGFARHVGALRALCPSLRVVSADGGALDAPAPSYPALRDVATGRDPAAPIGRDDAAIILFTSGTTGRPKGAVLTQDALFHNVVHSTQLHELTSADRTLVAIPLVHAGGLNNQTLATLHAGATLLVHEGFEAGAVLAAIARDRPTLACLVPAQLTVLKDHPGFAAADLSSLRMITTGSQIVPPRLIEIWHAKGVPLGQIYGMTELTSIAVALGAADARRKPGSIGKPAMHVEVRLAAEDGGEVAPGEPGEIAVRGPTVLKEYWRDKAATAAAFKDGWFMTGDIGHVDADGFWWIDDRKTEMIKSGGLNIYAAEIESVLAEHPAVAECAVVAAPDAKWGEVPVAFVVLKAGAVADGASLLAPFEGRLAKYKHPRGVRFVDALPRNILGKVERAALRRRLKEERG
jgi:fatty-acyl-CoA synthase